MGVPGIGRPAAVTALTAITVALTAVAVTAIGLLALMTVTVGSAAFDGIVGGVDLLHLFLGGFVAGVDVGMIFFCKLAICLFDFFIACVPADAKDFIGISHSGVPSFLFSFCSCRERDS